MARFYPQPDNSTIDVTMDLDSALVLPSGPASAGAPIAVGITWKVFDNLGKAGTTNITFTGPIGGGTTGTSISTNYGSTTFTWTGAAWMQK